MASLAACHSPPHWGEGAMKDGEGSGQHMEPEMCEGQKQHVNSTLVLQHSRSWRQKQNFQLTCVRHTFQYRVHFDLRQGRQREGWGRIRWGKSSWNKCKAGSHVTCNIWCLWSWGGMPHRPQICPQLCHTRPRSSHMHVCKGSTEGGSVTWSNGTSGERSSPAAIKIQPWGAAFPNQPFCGAFRWALRQERGRHEDSLKPPGGHLFLKTERERKEARNRWDVSGFCGAAGCRWLSVSLIFDVHVTLRY